MNIIKDTCNYVTVYRHLKIIIDFRYPGDFNYSDTFIQISVANRIWIIEVLLYLILLCFKCKFYTA